MITLLKFSLAENRPQLLRWVWSQDRELAEQIIITEAEVTWYAPRQPRLFDVRVRKDDRNSFTVLQVVDPGRLIIENEGSPFWRGYEYYVQDQEHEVCNGHTVVNTEKLEEELRKHLPDIRNLFVHKLRETHDQLPETAKEDHRPSMIFNAHFENDSIPEAIETLAASFLAAFFTILEDKS